MPAGSLHRIARSTLAWTPSRIDWWFVLRSSIGVAVSLAGGLATGSTLYAVAAGIGALSCGYVSLRGVYRTRAGAMLATAAGMSLCAWIAGLAGHSTAAMVMLVAAVAYAYGLFSSLGDAASAIGLNSTIAAIILGSIATPIPLVPKVALFVLAGGIVQTLLVVAAWPVGRHRTERRALADAYRAFAEYARAMPGAARPALVPHDALVTARAVLADPQPFGRRAELVALQTLADEAARIRTSLTLLSTGADVTADLAAAAAALLEEIARALDAARAPRDDGTWRRVTATLEHHATWHRLFGQIRSAWRSAALPDEVGRRTGVIDRSLVPHVEDWWRVVRRNATLDSPFGRHAIRLACVLAIGVLLYRTLHIERGYWIVLTAAIVMRPDYTSTLTRGLARIGGTLLGAALASAISLIAPLTPERDAILALICATLGYLTFPLNYALYSVTLTAYVVFLLSLAGLSEHAASVERIVATIIGGALGMAASVAWPTWESALTRGELADLLDLQRRYAVTLLDAYARAAPVDDTALESIAAQVWKKRSKADASVERMLAEPTSTYEITPGLALTILATEQRIALASIALRENIRGERTPPAPAAREFRDALDRALQRAVIALRNGTPPEETPPLREAYRALAAGSDAASNAKMQAILAQCDLYVDAVNTVAEAIAGDAV